MTDGCACLSHLLETSPIDSTLHQCLSNRTSTNDNEQNQCRTKISQQCNSCKRGHTGVASDRGHRCYKSVDRREDHRSSRSPPFRLLTTDTVQCFEYSNSLRSCSNGNEMVRSDDNRTISFEITPSYRNLNIRCVDLLRSSEISFVSPRRVLIGIEVGFADVICSVRNANFLVLNDQRVYFEYQSLVTEEPNFREFNLTNEDLNFGNEETRSFAFVCTRSVCSRSKASSTRTRRTFSSFGIFPSNTV